MIESRHYRDRGAEIEKAELEAELRAKRESSIGHRVREKLAEEELVEARVEAETARKRAEAAEERERQRAREEREDQELVEAEAAAAFKRAQAAEERERWFGESGIHWFTLLSCKLLIGSHCFGTYFISYYFSI